MSPYGIGGDSSRERDRTPNQNSGSVSTLGRVLT